MGAEQPPELTWGRVLDQWQFEPVVVVLLAVALALYFAGVRRTGGWPARRTALFVGGVAIIAVSLCGWIGVYEMTLAWVHMVQHLLLIMIAPALIVAGRPITLTLDATRGRTHDTVQRIATSRPVSALTHPFAAGLLYAVTIVGTHLTDFMNVVMERPALQALEHVLYLVVGILYFTPIFGNEPIRWKMSYAGRLALLLLSMPVDTFTGLVLMMSTDTHVHSSNGLPAWAPDPLTDTHVSGAIMWVGGDGIMMVMMLIVFGLWARDSSNTDRGLGWVERAREATLAGHVRSTGAQPRSGPADADDDSQLEAYNAWLASLSDRESDQPHRADNDR